MGRNKDRTKLKVGDKVRYTILGDIERESEITHTFPVSGGTMACLSRPDPEKKLKVDRCNAEMENLVKLD